jgi:hypothetical protein
MNREEFDRAKFTDRYARALQTQNDGGVCEGCGSALGHFSICPLINRNVAEATNAVLNQPDTDFLKALKITW